MNSNTMAQTLSQLVTLVPLMLVYLGGLIWCALWWRRAPQAALLAMLGIGLMLFGTVVARGISMYLIQSRMRGGSSSSSTSAVQIGQILSVVSIVSSLVHAGGIALLIAAVFAGRDREASGFDVTMQARSV
jgi:hypothetical protein